MLYAVIFLMGILIGALGAFACYFFLEWYPRIRYLKMREMKDGPLEDAAPTPDEQFLMLLDYQPGGRSGAK